jgi:glutamate-ammonia-ligase adenylyltransferase
MLRLACADLLGVADADTVRHGLTSVADATVRACLTAAHRRVFAERLETGGGLAGTVSVIAMGRFGGEEMGYSSDADVLFVAVPSDPDADPAAVLADATAIAELTGRLLGTPSPDPALTIDTDLRPEGRGGPLVRTVSSYVDYWQRNIAPWQRQALLRARAIDPNDPASKQFIDAIGSLRYPPAGLAAHDVREIRRM